MTGKIFAEAEDDLEQAFSYYESQRPRLGQEFLHEVRRALDLILEHPHAWQPLDKTYRRLRLHRFPYGVVYRVNDRNDEVVIVCGDAFGTKTRLVAKPRLIFLLNSMKNPAAPSFVR